ncbi:hypothetical protein DMENIID0001_060710 [Sergentomyia squamirostris]
MMEVKTEAICRICLSSEEECLLPLSEDFQGVSYWILYFECIGQTLKEYPDYPGEICSICRGEMIEAYKFKKKCLQAEKELSERVKLAGEKIVLVKVESQEEIQDEGSEYYPANKEEQPKLRRRGRPRKRDLEEMKVVELEDLKTRKSDINEKSVKCELCGKFYTNIRSLNAHRVYSHKLKPPPRPCPACGENFRNRLEKKQHNCYQQCEYCFRTVQGKAFVTHLQRHLNREKNAECDLCHKKYRTLTELKQHQRNHTAPNTVCPICGKMVREFRMHDHMKTHQPTKFLTCVICEKVFHNKGSIKRHMERIHLRLKIFNVQCTHCEMKFTNHAAQKAHIYKDHLKKPLYTCQLCGKGFYFRCSYQNHLPAHGILKKTFKCTFCDKTFPHNFLRLAHERVHTGMKMFNCSYCSRSFRARRDLNNHMLKHTGEDIYSCPYCSIPFSSVKRVRTHLKNDHPDKEMPPPRTVFLKRTVENLAKKRELNETMLQKYMNPQETTEVMQE